MRRFLPYLGWALSALLAVGLAIVASALVDRSNLQQDLSADLAGQKERAEQAEAEADRTAQTVAELETALAESEARIVELEAQLAAISPSGRSDSFGDGTYEVGTDIPAGEYKTVGKKDCYWAKLRPNNDIIDNNLSSGPQVVTLERGILFETQRCGTWTRSG